ncbi:PIG-L family deacetylase [Erythrobacter mangrovi]|uniref:PIG-L family deacetylase n=1 Tax=Erythrobacter mangrovi TaxID=2739433 RepID=A0A7D3XAB1_9SPHN|nr:PIG-L family deacetylase [Erythrobacter mangrovi]QKG70690.1 PIG-L family deacetylase [Erythrobacter mangrovi]
MRLLPVFALALTAGTTMLHAEDAAPPRILAVFAHPDDETVAAPALADAASRGAHVRIAYATQGDLSAPETTLAPGPEIAAVRSEEARCASRALGLTEPALLDFGDGQLGAVARPPWAPLRSLQERLAALVEEERPDIVITWGPDGGYGHPDHRLVGAVVSQIVAAQKTDRPLLLYPAMASGTLPPVPELVAMGWAETAPDLLTVRARFSPDSVDAATEAFVCHASQYDTATRDTLVPALSASVWLGGVPFRPALDPARGEDLLALER